MQERRKALLIEDDHDIAVSASLRLQAAGYETVIVGNAEQGLVLADGESPDVIILDIRLPQMDGLTALRRLKSSLRTRSIPVVALSASVVDQHTALDEGARFFLKKPYEACEFVRAVETAVRGVQNPIASGGSDGRPTQENPQHEHQRKPESPVRTVNAPPGSGGRAIATR